MSLGAEAKSEMAVYEALAYDHELSQCIKGIWTTKDGQKISVVDMTSRHIKNCINMLQKQGNVIAEMWVNRFKEELEYRNES